MIRMRAVWVACLFVAACDGSKSLGEIETMGASEEGGGTCDTAVCDGSSSGESSASTQGSTTEDTDASTAGEASSSESTGAYACETPLDEGLIDSLTWGHGPGAGLGVQPGNDYSFEFGFPGAEGYAEPIANMCVEWTVDPLGAATVAFEMLTGTGMISVSPEAESGSTITVSADVENGRAIVDLPTTVYTAATHPQVAHWHEVGWLSCTGGTALPTDGESRHIMLAADGSFSAIPATAPIAWGQYTFDVGTGELELEQQGGDGAMDFDGTGTVTFDSEQATFDGIWVAEIPRPADVCGQIFE